MVCDVERKKTRIIWVNRLRISQGHDGIYKVRSPKKPYPVLKEFRTEEAAYKWAHQNRKFAVKEPPWAEWELEYLADNYGRIPAEKIAQHLRRSPNALKIISFRKLDINQRSNIYTARALAQELGVSCAKTIVAWYDRGYLKGQPAPFKYGLNHVWFFDYDDIIECLENRPWLCNLRRMPESYFKSIVKKEWDKNPWYTRDEAAQFLGLITIGPIYRYIQHGWLVANRRPRGGGKGEWIIRHSVLAEFQLNDPRPLHRKGVTLPETIAHELDRSEEKAWTQLARGKFQMFGYWASVHQRFAATVRDPNHKNPFIELMKIAKERGKNGNNHH